MNIYLASGFNRRMFLRELTEKLHVKGHRVTSSWIWYDDRPVRETEEWDSFASKIAAANFLDLMCSDLLIVDTEGIRPENNGGVHFETGFMYAKNKLVYIVGERGNTFHWLPEIEIVKDYDELLGKL